MLNHFKAKFSLNIGRDKTTEDVINVEMDTPSIFERNRGAMCSFTVNNKMFMIGGDGFAYRNRHLEVIEETREIKELPELEIDFEPQFGSKTILWNIKMYVSC